jgi:hypothetical protein
MDFHRLPRELDPPPELENRTVAALQRGGWLRSRRPYTRGWVLAAASLLLFLSGVAAGRVLDRPAQDARPRFVILLMDSPPSESAEAEQHVVEAYRQWATTLRREGRFVSGVRLDHRGEAIPAAASSGERLEGYFVISAGSFEEAVTIAKACPHVARGGRVVVRPIAPT